jgi:hypothetical protein
MDEKALTTVTEKNLSPYSGGAGDFETAQRMAKSLAESDIVPQAYKGKIANCLVALEIANRTRSSVLAVMQNLNMIHGKPSWSSQYVIAAINSCGRFEPLKFEMKRPGKKTVSGITFEEIICEAVAIDKNTGEKVVGPPASIEIAIAEGWYQKAGSKWKTMPEVMVRYRAATFFGRLYCPEILLGMQSEDEARDVTKSVKSEAAISINEQIRQVSDAE